MSKELNDISELDINQEPNFQTTDVDTARRLTSEENGQAEDVAVVNAGKLRLYKMIALIICFILTILLLIILLSN